MVCQMDIASTRTRKLAGRQTMGHHVAVHCSISNGMVWVWCWVFGASSGWMELDGIGSIERGKRLAVKDPAGRNRDGKARFWLNMDS